MSDLVKTAIFAAVGIVLVIGAVIVHLASQPATIDQFELVGEEFYPEFDKASEATYLEVAAFDFDKRKQRSFRVEYREDKWRIPTHFDYPAEAADRLARTAASVMGIRRQALAGRRATEHKRFGVVDPRGEEAEKINRSDQDAVGVRVTLGKQEDDVLADYIIGKRVEVSGDLEDEILREIRGLGASVPLHYVRRPDEDETYVAAIEVDASTRFEDWIEPDLLLLEPSALRQLVVNDYAFETRVEEVELAPNSGIFQRMEQIERVDGEQYMLSKDTGFAPWKLEGIDEEVEEMETSKISQLTSALDNFKINGVRPRVKVDGYSIITPELKLEVPETFRSQDQLNRAITAVANDLNSKGFKLQVDQRDRSISIASDRGELTAATEEGVVYHLYFGDVVVGDEREIQLGISDETKDTDTGTDEDGESADAEPTSDGEPVDGEPSGEELDEDESKNRYLLVRVSFDPSLLGEPPMPPVEPTPPQATPPMDTGDGAAGDDNAGDDNSGDDTTGDDTTGDDTTGDDNTGDDNTGDDNTGDGQGSDSGDGATGSDGCGENYVIAAQDQDTDQTGNDQTGNDQTGNDQTGNDQTGDDQTGDDATGNDDAVTGGQDDDTDPTQQEPPVPQIDPQQQYQLEMFQYQAALATYEEQLAEYERRLAAGQAKVDQLNERFRDWYYLISNERLETLRLSRSDLVRPKEAETPALDPLQIPELDTSPPGNTDDGNDDGSTGDNTTGDNTTGDDTTGTDDGNDTTGGDTTGRDTTGNDNSGNNDSGNSQTGDNSSGGDEGQ